MSSFTVHSIYTHSTQQTQLEMTNLPKITATVATATLQQTKKFFILKYEKWISAGKQGPRTKLMLYANYNHNKRQ
jgi:hypothetical protein